MSGGGPGGSRYLLKTAISAVDSHGAIDKFFPSFDDSLIATGE